MWPGGPARRRCGGMSRAEAEQGSAVLRAPGRPHLSSGPPAPGTRSLPRSPPWPALCLLPPLPPRPRPHPCVPSFSAGGPRSLRARSGARTAPRAERKGAAAAGLLPPRARTRPAGSGRPPGQWGRAAAGQPPPQGMAGLGAGQAGREWRDGTGRVARSRALFPAPPRLGVPGGSGGETRVPAPGAGGGAGEQRRPRPPVPPSAQLARSPAFGGNLGDLSGKLGDVCALSVRRLADGVALRCF